MQGRLLHADEGAADRADAPAKRPSEEARAGRWRTGCTRRRPSPTPRARVWLSGGGVRGHRSARAVRIETATAVSHLRSRANGVHGGRPESLVDPARCVATTEHPCTAERETAMCSQPTTTDRPADGRRCHGRTGRMGLAASAAAARAMAPRQRRYQSTTVQHGWPVPLVAGSGSPANGVPRSGRHMLWHEVVCPPVAH